MLKKSSIKKHQGFIKYFKNTSWLFGEKVFRMIVGLFVGIWVARYLGPEKFGLFSYALSFVGLFTAIATLGLDRIVIREIVKDVSRTSKIIGTAFHLKVFGAILVLIILAIAVSFTSNNVYTNTLIFIIASATIFQSFNVVDMYFQSKVLSKFVVYANVISLTFGSFVKIILILNNAPLEYFAWAILFDSVILALGFIYFFLKQTTITIGNLIFKKSLAIILLRDSWPLILSGIVISIYMKIDQVMIKEILGVEAVGQYAAAVRLSEAWYFLPTVVVSSVFPAIINAKKVSEELYYSRLQKLYDLMAWMAILIAVPLTFLSDLVVEFLYGSAYTQAGGVLMVHVWAGIFVFLGVARGNWMITENLQRYSLIFLCIGVVVNISLNFFLIPLIGINGAAIATLLTQGTVILLPLFIQKTRKTFFMTASSLLLFPSVKRLSKA
tara:strand:- start:9286 stop:10605 length:1320 start_codon:yes stop_codon:yes gene_type:complete